jgi:hypothetical protein
MEYILELSDGKKIPLYFGTWSLARFCEVNGNLSLTQMQQTFANDISYKHVLSLLLCGAEHYARKNKKPFDYTDVDAGDWLDEIGGLESEKSLELLTVIGKTINPAYQGAEVVKEETSKKKSLAGMSSV